MFPGPLRVNEQAAAACVTVYVTPPMASVPVRLEAVELGATLKRTVPLPEPLVPERMVSQGLLEEAFQLQPGAVRMATWRRSPLSPAEVPVWERE